MSFSQLWCTSHRRDLVLPALRRSLTNLGMDYVDMFLIHFPVSMPVSLQLFMSVNYIRYYKYVG